jgi:MoaA/NifB/PqqE/SkfB family radical SAM enzyme
LAPAKFQRIHLELTNHCNFSCLFCPDGRMKRARGFMDVGMAEAALDQIADLDIAEKVTFHVMGEPLLHPHFFDILDHAHARDLKVGLTTNGALLTPDRIVALAERDLHQIDVSLQTPDQESFHATRGARIDFDRYVNRLMDLLAACAQRPSMPIFKFRIMTTRFAGAMRDKLGIPDFMGSTRTLRATILSWGNMIRAKLGHAPIPGDSPALRKIGVRGWNVVEVSPNVFIETYVLTDWGNAFSDKPVIEAGHGYCFGMRDHFAILRNGDVTLCCIDYEGKTAVGNLAHNSLDDILNGKELRPILEGLARFRLVHPHCRVCLGSTNAAASWVKPALSVIGLKFLKPLFYRRYRLFR